MNTIIKTTLLLLAFSLGLSAQEKKVKVLEDAYIQGGNTMTTPLGQKKPKDLLVFNSEAGTKYSRITYLKFKLPKKTKKVNSVELTINIKVYLSKKQNENKFSLQVYGVENDNWNESSITWDNAPELGEVLGETEIEQSYDSNTHTVTVKLDANKFNGLIERRDKYVTLALFNNNFNKLSSKLHAKEQGMSKAAYLKIK